MSGLNSAILIAVGAIATGFAATASKALREFSRSELQKYSRLRHRSDRFAQIMDGYEQTGLGIESLQIVGTVVLVLAIALDSLLTVGGLQNLSIQQLAAIATVSAVVVLTVTTWIPEAVVALWTEPFVYHSWPLLRIVAGLMWPLTLGVKIVGAFFRRLADRPETEEDEEEAFEDELLSVVTEGMHDGILKHDKREMIEGVIELGGTEVAEIMTPRSNIDALDVNLPWEEVMDSVVRFGRTRIPVFENTLDNVVGVLYVKDLLREFAKAKDGPHLSLRQLLREACFVPTTKPLDAMLQEFLQTRNHLAIVIDEYTAVAGVVTIEDVLEEIVGEIVDESDPELEEKLRIIDESTAEVLGTLHVDVLNAKLGLDFADPDEYDTVAGLVIAHLGRIPKPGESLLIGRTRLTVLEGSRRKVERLKVEIQEPAAAGQAN